LSLNSEILELLDFHSNNDKVDDVLDRAENQLNNDVANAIALAEEANQLSQNSLYTIGLARSLKIKALAYQNLTNYSEAMRFAIESRELYKVVDDKRGEAACLNILGGVYNFLGDLKKRLETNIECLELRRSIADDRAVLSSLNNIGDTYLSMKDFENALSYFFKCLKFDNLSDNILAIVKCNIAETYFYLNKLELSNTYVDEGLKHAIVSDYYQIIIAAHILKARISILNKNYKEAILNLDNASKVLSEKDSKEQQFEAYQLYSEVYHHIEDYEKAFLFLNKHNELKDAVLSENNAQKMKKIEFDFQLKSITTEAKQIKEKNELLTRAFTQIESQSNEIKAKNNAITDSIHYAKRIQRAILPENEKVQKCLQDHFIFYQPKDIVSGDFYWVEQVGDNVVFGVIDCTGHGVPGAFVSLIANNALNKVVLEQGITKPGTIINEVNSIITELFMRSEENIRDGMDMGICCWNKKENTFQFAGAYNSLFVYRDNKLTEIKGNRESVGASIFNHEKDFVNHQVDIIKGDLIYLSTDGLPDQFGGRFGKKLKWKGFRKLLSEIAEIPIGKQQIKLTEFFEDWKGNLEQLDDICVLAVKI